MNLNGDFEVQAENGEDVVLVTEPDFELNKDNQPVDPNDPDVVIQPEPEVTLSEALGDFADDVQGLIALESALQDLEYVAEDIARHGGINQEIALEADRCASGFLNDSRPIGFYTKTVSATNLKYAIETINYKKAGIIAAIVAAIVAAFYKLIEWVTKNTAKSFVKEFVERADKVASGQSKYQKSPDAENDVGKIYKDVADHSNAPNSQKLINSIDGLTEDTFAHNSVVLKKIGSIFKDNGGMRGFALIFSNLETALDSIIETGKKQIGSYMIVDAVEAEFQIKKMAESLHPAMSAELGMLRTGGGHEPISAILSSVRTTIDQLKTQNKPIDNFSKVIIDIKKFSESSVVADYISLKDAYSDALKKMKPKLDEAAKMIEKGRVETERRISESPNYKGKEFLVKALKNIQHVVASIGGLIQVMEFVLVNNPKRFLLLIERAYVEAKAYRKVLAEKYETSPNAALENEIKRLDAYLEAFK